MKKLLILSVLGASIVSSFAYADNTTSSNVNPDQITVRQHLKQVKQQWGSMTEEQKQAVKQKAQAAWKKLTPEEQASIKQHMQVKNRWSKMTPQQQQEAINKAKQALAVIPPYERKQLLMKRKDPGQAGRLSVSSQKRQAWKALTDLPPAEHAKIVNSTTAAPVQATTNN